MPHFTSIEPQRDGSVVVDLVISPTLSITFRDTDFRAWITSAIPLLWPHPVPAPNIIDTDQLLNVEFTLPSSHDPDTLQLWGR